MFVVAGLLVHADIVVANPAVQIPAANVAASSGAAGAEPVASRLVTTSVDLQLATLRSRMKINASDKGPFGFFQDPEKAATQVINIPGPEVAIKQVATPFDDVVQAIPVSVVIPSAQEFVVNSRTFRGGEQFPLVLGSETLTVRVERVRSSGILLKNMNTGVVAEKRMNFLPEGVIESKGGEILPDGITRIGSAKQELVIDPANIKPTINGRSR